YALRLYTQTDTSYLYTLSLHDALPIWIATAPIPNMAPKITANPIASGRPSTREGPIDTRTVDIAVSPPWSETVTITSYIPLEVRSEEHTSELQSRFDLVCRLPLEIKKQ